MADVQIPFEKNIDEYENLVEINGNYLFIYFCKLEIIFYYHYLHLYLITIFLKYFFQIHH